jgi:hypothetical protein
MLFMATLYLDGEKSDNRIYLYPPCILCMILHQRLRFIKIVGVNRLEEVVDLIDFS